MARSYRPVNRDQPFLLPPDMREWLPAGHLVWFLLETLKQVDLRPFHARHRNDGVGRAAYDPDMMVALLIYAYCCGERSSRQIERLCQVNVAFRVVCAGDIPDHTKIARFRAQHQDAFEAVFAQVLSIAARAGLAKFETVAIDGTKIAANASLLVNRDADWFLREEVAVIIAQARAADESEDREYGPDDRGDPSPPQLRDPSQRGARIKAAAEQIEAEKAAAGARQEAWDAARAIEAAARLERMAAGQRIRGRAPRGADRVGESQTRLDRMIATQQAKIDRRAARIAAGERPGGKVPVPIDQHVHIQKARAVLAAAQAHVDTPLARDLRRHKNQIVAKANLTDPQSRIMPTRKGWMQGYNAQLAITADQIIVALSLGQNPVDTEAFIPMMRAAQDAAARLHALTCSPDHVIGTVLADAGYPSEENLAAEGPPRLIALGKSRDQAKAAKTTPTQGEPPPDATPREAMDHRLRTPEGAKLYKRRGATVEPGIGNLKKLLTGFSRRGLEAARGELNLAATAFNLRKIHTAALN
jgi:transposase